MFGHVGPSLLSGETEGRSLGSKFLAPDACLGGVCARGQPPEPWAGWSLCCPAPAPGTQPGSAHMPVSLPRCSGCSAQPVAHGPGVLIAVSCHPQPEDLGCAPRMRPWQILRSQLMRNSGRRRSACALSLKLRPRLPEALGRPRLRRGEIQTLV